MSNLDVLFEQNFVLKPEQTQTFEVDIPEDGLQNFAVVFQRDEDTNKSSLGMKSRGNRVTFTFTNWAYIDEHTPSEPWPIGATDHTGREFYLDFSLRNSHEYTNHRSVEEVEGRMVIQGALVCETTHHLNLRILVDPVRD